MTNDEILKAAFEQTMDEHFSQYDLEENEKPHKFSLAFYIRKISIVRLAKKAEKAGTPVSLPQRKYIPLRRLAVIIALIGVIAVLTAAVWVTDIFVPGFIFEVHTTHSDVNIDLSLYEIKEEITEYYWLPPESGCKYVSQSDDDSEFAIIEYTYNGKTLLFAQYAGNLANNTTTMVNTENADVYAVSVNGDSGFVCIRQREGEEDSTFILWLEYGYEFQISCVSLTQEDLINLAESIAIKETIK